MSCCGRGKVPPVGWGVRDAVVAETLMTNIDVPEEGDVVGVAPVLEEETVIEEPVKKPRGRPRKRV